MDAHRLDAGARPELPTPLGLECRHDPRFGIAHTFRGYKEVAERSAFLVDRDAVIRGAWRYETNELPDFDELVAAARSLSPSP